MVRTGWVNEEEKHRSKKHALVLMARDHCFVFGVENAPVKSPGTRLGGGRKANHLLPEPELTVWPVRSSRTRRVAGTGCRIKPLSQEGDAV